MKFHHLRISKCSLESFNHRLSASIEIEFHKLWDSVDIQNRIVMQVPVSI